MFHENIFLFIEKSKELFKPYHMKINRFFGFQPRKTETSLLSYREARKFMLGNRSNYFVMKVNIKYAQEELNKHLR